MMNQSRALTTIARTVQRIIPFHEPPVLPANQIWDNRHSGTAATLLSEEKLKQIGTSCGEQATDPIDPDKCVVELTTAELERLNDSSTDTLQYVKPAYQVPPPSLAASEAGDEVEDDDLYGADDEAVSTSKKLLEAGNQATGVELEADEQSVPFPNFFDNMSMSYEGILDRIRTARGLTATRKSASLMKPSDEEFATKYQSKDLRTIIAPYTGFYIMAPDGLQTVLDMDNNISEYYQLPLIDPMIDEDEFDVGSMGPRTSPFSPSNYDSSDDSHSDSDSEENILQPPRSQPPSQAIIQYLTYKGQPLSSITSLLAPLDTCFLYHQTSRWFRTIRIPEHHELNDAMIAAVLEECKAEKQWWEEEVDKQGNVIPQELRILQGRMRERKVGHLARMSLENYFWWRLRGEMPHGMLPHGPLLREGGY
jgi:hypothetical protein